jgi:hypothetical protein
MGPIFRNLTLTVLRGETLQSGVTKVTVVGYVAGHRHRTIWDVGHLHLFFAVI